MLKKRIIPCLDIKDGRTVKGINFKGLKDAGDPIALAKSYVDQGADELVFLDISATEEKRKTLAQLVKKIAREINIPFTVGGGISSIEDVKTILLSGADKISINSAAVKSPLLIKEISSRFGAQCTTVAIDYKKVQGKDEVYISGGKIATGIKLADWIKKVTALGAGELLLTSMDHDGKKQGFDLNTLNEISSKIKIPIIASGGAGTSRDFSELFTHTNISAGLAASIFHYKEITIPELKNYLLTKNIAVRC